MKRCIHFGGDNACYHPSQFGKGLQNGEMSCLGCPKRVFEYAMPQPDWPVFQELPPQALQPNRQTLLRLVDFGTGQVSNCSLIRYNGKLLLAYRCGWRKSNIALATLDESYQMASVRVPKLDTHPAHAHAREDPRLFHCAGGLWMSYTGVNRAEQPGQVARTMFSELSDDVCPVHAPYFGQSRKWEKNWMFFEHDGELLSVYDSHPLRIAKMSKDFKHYTIFKTAHWNRPEALGMLRGGCPPVRVGDEYYVFGHGSFMHGPGEGGRWDPWYVATLFTFCAKTFVPLRVCRNPLMIPRPGDCPKGWQPKVVYPGGAVFDNGVWKISYGYHDHACWIAEFTDGQIEQVLE